MALAFSALAVASSCGTGQIPSSLVPETPSKAPDYFCTWNLQGYVCNYSSNELQRATMNERYMFGSGTYENWLENFPEIRMDLDFVMDDSWDIPQDQNSPSNNPYLGTIKLDTTRFPSYTALRQIVWASWCGQ